MPAYIIVEIEVVDPVGYEEYKKLAGATVGARVAGLGWRDSATVGALMNTRGLTELVVLDVGKETGLIDGSLYTVLVLMAVITTIMSGPLLAVLRPSTSQPSAPHSEIRSVDFKGNRRADLP